jgi:hypothetical protein
MATIYFDESGQTGTQLLDAEQPFFCLGSTSLSEAESSEILSQCFPRQTGELKAQNVLKRTTGRRQFLAFAKELARHSGQTCVGKVHKRFTVISKMVDNLVEPMLRAQGYDFYKNDYARSYANSAYFVFDQVLAPQVSDGLVTAYNDFAREPTASTLRRLQTALASALDGAPYGSELFLDMMAIGADNFEAFHELDQFEDTNDIHVAAVLRCMSHWQAQTKEAFEVVHDDSNHFFAQAGRWKLITDPKIEQQILAVGDKTLTLPINVAKTISAKSHESASLQVCDLLAGFISRASSPNLSPEFQKFVSEAIEAGFGGISIFPIEPGTEFMAGPPEYASDLDVVDKIALAMSKARATDA